MKILVINGPNLNMLGIREPNLYGTITYSALCKKIISHAEKLGMDIEIYQSNHEGALVDKIQSAYMNVDGIVINPGAYTHTSIALLDAVKAVDIPTVEVHISDISEREKFRQVSYIRSACIKTIIGHGIDGYLEAIDFLSESLGKKSKMTVTIYPSIASGIVNAPPSKSMAHRLLISAGLAKGQSTINGIAFSEDILATLDCLRALGANYHVEGNKVKIVGADLSKFSGRNTLCCRESGSTLRFMIPIALTSGATTTLTGSKKLLSRPLGVYTELASKKSFLFDIGDDKIVLQGPLASGNYTVDGKISSQFISGLLFALPLVGGDSKLVLTPPVESKPYIDMTVDTLSAFGIKIVSEGNTYIIPGGQSYHPCDVTVEGDYSNAAFLDAMNLIGGDVHVKGLKRDSLQGDKVYRNIYKKLKGGKCTIDISNCPDLGPILIALAALLDGATFTGTKRLAFKESDRAVAMAEELKKCGVEVEVQENKVIVSGGILCAPSKPLTGHNDHRIVMALSVILTKVGGKIEGAEAVAKSYPDFFERLHELGVKLTYDRLDT